MSAGERGGVGAERTGLGAATGSAVDLTDDDLAAMNERFGRTRDPLAVLRWGAETFAPGTLIMTTAFGPGGMVLFHLLREAALRVPVIFVDTLHHFPETLALAARVKEAYELDLRVLRPAVTRAAFETEYGERLWERDLDRYHEVSRVEPLRRGLVEVRGWITARRRDQNETRADLPWVERAGPRIKLNPIASWARDDVWTFLRENRVPYNPLHDQGYASIGDEPLTTPVEEGEHERAGRWRGRGRTECGIHLI